MDPATDKEGASSQVRPGENPDERADRNFDELLQELRVAMPGVQFLFAFLLTVPLATGYENLDSGQKDLYFGVLLSTALTTVLLMAPSAYHRALFRMRDKSHLVEIANRFTIAGLTMLGVSITAAVLLTADIVFDGLKVIIFTAFVGLTFALFWGVLPVARRRALAGSNRTGAKEK